MSRKIVFWPTAEDTLIVNAGVRLPRDILGDRQSGRVAAWLIFLSGVGIATDQTTCAPRAQAG